MNIALFDFDGTITNNDNYTMFIRYSCGRKRLIALQLLLFPVIAGYRLKIISPAKTRELVAGCIFRGQKLDHVMEQGRKYSSEILPLHIRKRAQERITWHREQGDRIVVVSASLDFYLKHWCEDNGFDLICSHFETSGGVISGSYHRGDCSGKQKAIRVMEKYDLSLFETVYAYGDTTEDRELLDLAAVKFFRWKQVDRMPVSETECDTGNDPA